MSAATIKDPRDVVLAPVVSEKSTILGEAGKYVFGGSLFSAQSPAVVTVKQPITITK